MTDKEIAKKAYELAEQEARDKQIGEVKKIVTKTLEKLDGVKKEIKELQDEERILKLDIDDLKEGRLDRIAERQEKDTEAKKVSVVLIIKEKEIIREVHSPYYWPYTVVWQQPYIPTYYNGTTLAIGGTTLTTNAVGNSICDGQTCDITLTNSQNNSSCTLSDGSNFQATVTPTCITGSVAKYATVGSYDVHGHIINLR